METVTGYVDHVVFRNEENGYTVFNLESDDGEVTCVGSFHYITEGELLELEGEYVNHSVYGTQLKVLTHKVKEPEDLVSIERYLGSGAIKGIGASLAGRIVRRFKEDTFRIMEEEPERLAEIKGISKRKAQEIAVQVEEKRDMRKAMIFLQKYGISTALAVKIYEYYGSRLYEVMQENPYQLADNISGVGFKTADEIASRIGIHKDSDFRIRSGLVILPLLPGPRLLYNRNLLYTAVTRAKKCLTIVGSESVFQEMIRNKSEQNRYTSLAERIQEF